MELRKCYLYLDVLFLRIYIYAITFKSSYFFIISNNIDFKWASPCTIWKPHQTTLLGFIQYGISIYIQLHILLPMLFCITPDITILPFLSAMCGIFPVLCYCWCYCCAISTYISVCLPIHNLMCMNCKYIPFQYFTMLNSFSTQQEVIMQSLFPFFQFTLLYFYGKEATFT